MNDYDSMSSPRWQPKLRRVATAIGALAAVAIVVLFAWNSFAVPVLDAEMLRFKEALGRTLLVAIAGRLFASRDHRHARIEG